MFFFKQRILGGFEGNMGTQGTGRKRSTKKERSTAEDDALNLIAREVSGGCVSALPSNISALSSG